MGSLLSVLLLVLVLVIYVPAVGMRLVEFFCR